MGQREPGRNRCWYWRSGREDYGSRISEDSARGFQTANAACINPIRVYRIESAAPGDVVPNSTRRLPARRHSAISRAAFPNGCSRREGPAGPAGEELIRRSPDPECHSGEPGRAERGGLDQVGPLHRHAEHVGLELHQPVVGGGSAVHPHEREREPAARDHRLQQVGGPERHRLERGAHQVGAWSFRG